MAAVVSGDFDDEVADFFGKRFEVGGWEFFQVVRSVDEGETGVALREFFQCELIFEDRHVDKRVARSPRPRKV